MFKYNDDTHSQTQRTVKRKNLTVKPNLNSSMGGTCQVQTFVDRIRWICPFCLIWFEMHRVSRVL
jgi:hypothetical protein